MVMQLIGTPEESDLGYLNENARRYVSQLPHHKPQSFPEKFPHVHPQAIDLIQKMLTFDPRKRISGDIESCIKEEITPFDQPAPKPEIHVRSLEFFLPSLFGRLPISSHASNWPTPTFTFLKPPPAITSNQQQPLSTPPTFSRQPQITPLATGRPPNIPLPIYLQNRPLSPAKSPRFSVSCDHKKHSPTVQPHICWVRPRCPKGPD
ncbi:hypothetical protein KSP39_PZI013731 [Platanthera zijinensis]|uniref:Protein kinase domain-containing protein n=1 Tax=Platanthera zijinensis TaxID=2320716 RepID=A0AAP0BD17_9ASPA